MTAGPSRPQHWRPHSDVRGDRRRLMLLTGSVAALVHLCALALSVSATVVLYDGVRSNTTGNTGRPVALSAAEQTSNSMLDVAVQLVANYTRDARRLRHTDSCRLFMALNATLPTNNVTTRRPATGDYTPSALVHLQYIANTFYDACVDADGSAGEAVQCLEDEMSSILWQSCQQRLTFNVRQRTHPTCFFVQESSDCKLALVTSSCGASALAYHVIALMTSSLPLVKALPSVTCHVRPLSDTYPGFRYDANCPAHRLTADMEMCASRYLYSGYDGLSFRADNDLVATTTDAASINNACTSFRAYKLCVRPINKACRRGVQLVYEQQTVLRLYRLKMDFICQKANRREYIRHVSCYASVLQPPSDVTPGAASDVTAGAAGDVTTRGDVTGPAAPVRQCDAFWQQRVRPALRQLSAVQFYCDVSSSRARSVRRQLRRVRQCYQRVVRRHCGPAAANTLTSLIRRAFLDPHYQRFRYRPHCRLHGGRARQRPRPPPVTSTDQRTINDQQSVFSSVRRLGATVYLTLYLPVTIAAASVAMRWT